MPVVPFQLEENIILYRYLLFDDWIGFRLIFTNPLFLSVFFFPQLFDNLSFTGIPSNGNSITLESCARILGN